WAWTPRSWAAHRSPWPRGRRYGCTRRSWTSPSTRVPVSTCSRASPGTSAPTPPAVSAPRGRAGHVGADAAGVILAEEPYERDDVSLVVDVGTNAEIVLGNRERLLAA